MARGMLKNTEARSGNGIHLAFDVYQAILLTEDPYTYLVENDPCISKEAHLSYLQTNATQLTIDKSVRSIQKPCFTGKQPVSGLYIPGLAA